MVFFIGRISFIVLIVFLVALVLQLIYIWLVFGKTAFYKKREQSEGKDEPVSVVVVARDSLSGLMRLIPALLRQNYPDFEIVIVNNCSTDDTQLYLDDLERNEPRVKIVQLRQQLNFFRGKKFPLSMGIKSAKHDLLFFTDPDCEPVSDNWLSSMVGGYGKDTEIVLGYCPRRNKKGLFDKIIRYVDLIDGLNIVSFALLGHPYSADGKCLSYRKSLFYRGKGFTSHYTVSSGDDSLFVNDNANKKNTSVVIDSDNAVKADTISILRWFMMKSYRCSVIPHYSFGTKLMLSLYPLTQMLFYASLVALLFLKPAFEIAAMPVLYIPALVVLFLIRFVSQTVVLNKSAKRLGEVRLAPWFFFGDIFYLVINPVVVFLGVVGKGAKWGD